MPEGMDTHETLKYIFKHCCKCVCVGVSVRSFSPAPMVNLIDLPFPGTFGRTSADGTEANSIDNANFMKMVKKVRLISTVLV